ncbi:MAG: cytochrome c3 family protein [Geovibrio sp.]|nr:cytochrome c3 family protein [Geovibrio sp.]
MRWYMADLSCSDCHDSAFERPNTDKCIACHDDSYADIMTDTQAAFAERLQEVKAKYAQLFTERSDMPMGKRALFNEYARIIRIA